MLGRGTWTHFIPASRLGRRVERGRKNNPITARAHSARPRRIRRRCRTPNYPSDIRAKSNEPWKGLVCSAAQISSLAISA